MGDFEEREDNLQRLFFSVITDSSAPTTSVRGITSSFNRFLTVEEHHKSPFTQELTERDDVLLAFLSLLLLLVIQGLATTILLRTKDGGSLSMFGFTAKQVIELINDFKIQRIVRGGPAVAAVSSPTSAPINNYGRSQRAGKILATALCILSLTFGLEVAVLFLTNPVEREVRNNSLSFRVIQPVIPRWGWFRFHSRATFSRPCSALSLRKVIPGNTRINACVTSDLPGDEFDVFEKAKENVTVRIQSDLHEYGADHEVTIGELTARYSVRIFFSLGDDRTRIMHSGGPSENEAKHVEFVQKQFVAYLVGVYRTFAFRKDKTMDLDRLNQLEFDVSDSTGPVITINRAGNNVTTSKSRRYELSTEGILPQGTAALRLGHYFFHGATAIGVGPPDKTDLFTETGVETVEAVMWSETVRQLNWLTLLIVLILSMALLAGLRFVLKPVSSAEIAGVLVKSAVGADLYRSPVEVDESERQMFRLMPKRGDAVVEEGPDSFSGTGTDSDQLQKLEEWETEGTLRT